MKHSAKQFHVVYREENGWFIATVPALPGCHTQGKSLSQAEKRIKEAIEAYLESMQVRRQPLPKTDQRVFLSSIMIEQ
jgi:antitoxin HicB